MAPDPRTENYTNVVRFWVHTGLAHPPERTPNMSITITSSNLPTTITTETGNGSPSSITVSMEPSSQASPSADQIQI